MSNQAENNEPSVLGVFMERLKGPFWGPFLLSWCLVNWKVILVIISWNSKEIDDKIKYIEKLFEFTSGNSFSLYSPFSGEIFFTGTNYITWGNFYVIWTMLLLPVLLSYIAIWWIPKISKKFLEKQLADKNVVEELYSQEQIRKIHREGLLEKARQEIEKENEVEWKGEFEGFIEEGVVHKIIDSLRSLIYARNGNANGIAVDEISFLDSMSLIQLKQVKEGNAILSDYGIYEITEKGRFFMKLHSIRPMAQNTKKE